MTDPTPFAIAAVMHGDAARFPLVALAGMTTSVGPCVAPRYIALASMLDAPRRTLTLATFVAGIVTVYTALGFAAGLFETVTRNAGILDIVLAIALGAGGLTTLLRAPRCAHLHDAPVARPRRLSGVFCLGAASALVISPCCTPIVAAVVAFPSLDPSPLARAALLGAFALGHAAPLLVLGAAGTVCLRRLRQLLASAAPSVVSGTLMLALATYYGLLV